MIIIFCASIKFKGFSQLTIEKDSFSVRILPSDSPIIWDINEPNIINTYQTSIPNICAYIKPQNWVRYISNDTTKVEQYLDIKKHKEYKWSNPKIKIEIERVLRCKFSDTVHYCEVWFIKPSKIYQKYPLMTDTTLYNIYDGPFNGNNIYYPDLEGDPPVLNMIAKKGTLESITTQISSHSNHIVFVDESSDKKARYTFELSKAIIERGNFEEIKAALKEAIDFDMYKEIRPIKKTYIKFLD